MMTLREIVLLVLVVHISSTMPPMAEAAEGLASAPTLAPPSSDDKSPNADRFIQRWLILEPVRANGLTDRAIQAAVKKEYFPNQFTMLPKDGDKLTFDGGGATDFCARFLDAEEKPLKGFTVNAGELPK